MEAQSAAKQTKQTKMNDTPRIFLSPPHMSGREQALVQEAFASNYIAPLGPMVDAFEQEFAEYTGIPHCLALASGTAATHLALRHVLQGSGGSAASGPASRPGPACPAPCGEAALVHGSRPEGRASMSAQGAWFSFGRLMRILRSIPRSALAPGRGRATGESRSLQGD